MSQKLIVITGMPYSEYCSLPKDEIVSNAIYLLENGMIFVNGEKYGSDILIVKEFPISPIPHVIYINSNTLEKKIWLNDDWYILQSEFAPLSNSEIENMFKDDF